MIERQDVLSKVFQRSPSLEGEMSSPSIGILPVLACYAERAWFFDVIDDEDEEAWMATGTDPSTLQ